MDEYFNFQIQTATSSWQRRGFLGRWRKIYARDSRWCAPYLPAMQWALNPDRNEHLSRMRPYVFHLEARLRKRNSSSPGQVPSTTLSSLAEVPVAAAVVLFDPRRDDRTAYLTLFHCTNDRETLHHLLEHLAEVLLPTGYRRLIGPTGLSPHLGSGLLLDCWDQAPPWHTSYNPPYLPELVDGAMNPVDRWRLYFLAPEAELPSVSAPQVTLEPLEPGRLATDLLPLMVDACSMIGEFSQPDETEIAFLLRLLGTHTLFGWLAQVAGEPVGFVLLQPDLSARIGRAGGGRNLLWRLWLAGAMRRPVREGRVLFGTVIQGWRGKGIGRQLLTKALMTAREHGWHSLSVGPLPEGSAGSSFLLQNGAVARQTYQLYEWTL